MRPPGDLHGADVQTSATCDAPETQHASACRRPSIFRLGIVSHLRNGLRERAVSYTHLTLPTICSV
eukprot:7918101-Prorocentrum_lima.AAC.1